MRIGLDQDQRAFADACARLAGDLAGRWSPGRGPDDVAPVEPDATAWARVCAAGWLTVGLAEDVPASVVDLAVLVEQLGYHTVPVPVLGALLGAERLRAGGADPAVLARVGAGELRVAPLLRADLTGFATDTDAVAWDSAGAEVAFAADGTAHRLGDPLPGADLTRHTRAVGTATTGIPLADPGQHGRSRLAAFGRVLATADLLGVMRAALDDAVAHARTRTQFGRPIGAFQAIQQLAAESLVSVEASRSALYHAAWAVDALSPPAALAAASTAKAFVAPAAVEVCETAIQILGGVGLTWESRAHVRLRRAHTSRALFGDEHHQLRALTDHLLGAR
ncbi:acyl-CoA dehydrogenase family protein [Actinophytocola sediminis]